MKYTLRPVHASFALTISLSTSLLTASTISRANAVDKSFLTVAVVLNTLPKRSMTSSQKYLMECSLVIEMRLVCREVYARVKPLQYVLTLTVEHL